MGASLIDLNHFDDMKSIGKTKLMKRSHTKGDIILNYFSQILFDSVIFIQILPKVHS